jgi:hypothetical protein
MRTLSFFLNLALNWRPPLMECLNVATSDNFPSKYGECHQKNSQKIICKIHSALLFGAKWLNFSKRKKKTNLNSTNIIQNMVYESKLNHSPNWAKSSCPPTSQNWKNKPWKVQVLYKPAFKKNIGESFLPTEKLKLKMKNEVIFRISRFSFPVLILAKI